MYACLQCLPLLSIDCRGYGLDPQTQVIVRGVWSRSTDTSDCLLQAKTFGCTWHGEACSLTLDFETGFSLYNNQAKVGAVSNSGTPMVTIVIYILDTTGRSAWTINVSHLYTKSNNFFYFVTTTRIHYTHT